MKKIIIIALAILFFVTGIDAGHLFYIVQSTTPAQVITGRAKIYRITFGNPSSNANAVSFFDHTAMTTTYTSAGYLFRADAPAADQNIIQFNELKPTLDFAVAISTCDCKNPITSYTTSWVLIEYR